MTREQAIEILKRKTTIPNDGENFDDISDAFDMAIEALSSSKNPNKWIPVSERLPEEAGMYLCSYDDDDVGTSYFDIRMNEFNMLHEQVTAWMYIPEPYKQEVEG